MILGFFSTKDTTLIIAEINVGNADANTKKIT